MTICAGILLVYWKVSTMTLSFRRPDATSFKLFLVGLTLAVSGCKHISRSPMTRSSAVAPQGQGQIDRLPETSAAGLQPPQELPSIPPIPGVGHAVPSESFAPQVTEESLRPLPPLSKDYFFSSAKVPTRPLTGVQTVKSFHVDQSLENQSRRHLMPTPSRSIVAKRDIHEPWRNQPQHSTGSQELNQSASAIEAETKTRNKFLTESLSAKNNENSDPPLLLPPET